MISNLLIIGGNSDIAYEFVLSVAHAYPLKNIFLASRNHQTLITKAQRIEQQTQVATHALWLDLENLDALSAFYHALPAPIDTVIVCAGYLGTNNHSIDEAKKIALINYVGPSLLLDLFAEDFIKRDSGLIIGLSSVAGIRGRASNYHYGAAKAALFTYLSGLRNRLSKTPIQVITVLPGFVDTKMTQHMQLPKLLTSTPHAVAEQIVSAIKKKKEVIYIKPIWRYIMLVISLLPEKIFKRTRI